MADNILDTPSFGIVDTIATSSQELVDDFLNDSATVTTKPDDIKDINTPEPPKEEKKKPAVKEEVAPKPITLDDIKDEGEEDVTEDGQEEEEDVTKEGEETESNPFRDFSKGLFDIGAFEKDGDEEPVLPETPQDFLNLMNEQLGKRANTAIDNYLSRFGEDYRDAFDAIYEKGVHPKEYFQTYNAIQSFSEMNLDGEENKRNQELVVRQKLLDEGYEDADVDSEIKRLEDYGDLENVAKKHHKVLIKKETQKLQELTEKAEEKRKAVLASKQQFAQSVNKVLSEKLKTKEFDGIPINQRLAEEVQDMLLAEKWKNSAGEPLTDFDVEILNLKLPQNHELKTKVALLLKILKDDPTLSTIKKSGVTKETNTLFNEVVRNKPKTNTNNKQGNSAFSHL